MRNLWLKFSIALFASTSLLVAQTTSRQSMKGLVLVDRSDPEFIQDLNTYFPDVVAASDFAAIEPLTVIVINRGSVAVRAYSVLWSLTSANGKVQQIDRVVVEHALSQLSPTAPFPLTGRQVIIAPGEAQLVTPLSDWSTNKHRAHTDTTFLPELLAGYAQTSIFTTAQSAVAIHSVFDGIVGDDNSITGTDSLQLAKSYRAARNAEHDEAASIMKLLAANATQPEIVSTLQADIMQANVPIFDNPAKSAYMVAKGQEASYFLVLYKGSGISVLTSVATNLMQVHKTLLSKQ